jgi:hypothetical protein
MTMEKAVSYLEQAIKRMREIQPPSVNAQNWNEAHKILGEIKVELARINPGSTYSPGTPIGG